MDNKEYKNILIKRSYKFSLGIMRLIDNLPRKHWSCEIVGKQVIRSATSVGANIVEAQASSSKRDFTNFLNHSLKSANETKYWLGLLRDNNYLDKNKVNVLLSECTELANLLGSSILKLKGKR